MLDSALFTASEEGRAEEVLRLLADAPDIEERGGDTHGSPLHVASFFGHGGVVRVLAEHGADVSARNNTGATPLHHAAVNPEP